MDAFTNGFSLDALLDVLRRRRWTALMLLSMMLTISISFILFLPSIYNSSALILIEGQQIPTDFVRSTVTMEVGHRLKTISQKILSRPRLEQLITEFGLYRGLRDQGIPLSNLANIMRKDIGVKIQGTDKALGKDTVAFQVSYTSPSPQQSMQVANVLASFYIKENLKTREEQAAGTTHFLQKELDEAKRKLEAQEQRISEYKKLHLGELPEQLDTNRNMLEVLQQQMHVVSGSLSRARERQNALLAVPDNVDVSQLESLKTQLNSLRRFLREEHPDVVRLKQMVATQENALSRHSGRTSSHAMSPVQSEQIALVGEIQRLNTEFKRVQDQIALYQQRIENTPKHEQDMLSISRDYETTSNLYASLLERLDEAHLADRLEQRQKAERFRLIEPATIPTTPEAPRRIRFYLLGVILSLGIAAGGVVLQELFDSSFHRIEDLRAFTRAPVLASIPHAVTTAVREQRLQQQFLGSSALAVLLLMLMGVSYWIAADNELLVRTLGAPSSEIQIRE